MPEWFKEYLQSLTAKQADELLDYTSGKDYTYQEVVQAMEDAVESVGHYR